THCGKLSANAITHEAFDLRGRHAGDAAGFGLAILQQRLRDIIPVAHTLLVCMCRAHPVAAIIIKASREKSGRASQADVPANAVGGEFFLRGLEQVAAEDRFMLATIHLAPVSDLA